MRIAVVALALSVGALWCAALVRRRVNRFDATLRDYQRREWANGVDGPNWSWPVEKN